jgi:glucose-6-phosphate 1-epimerase
MADPAASSAELFRGQPSVTLCLPCGDRLRVMLHGAHVVSWVAGGRERLYLSPRSHFDGRSAIRGGVPVCFPQFNQRGPLPKHGFARNLPWQAGTAELAPQQARLALSLAGSQASRQYWPLDFEATLTLELRPGRLQIVLDVLNRDAVPLAFTGALHTYLAVDDIAAAELTGLQGQREWDALTDHGACAAGPLRFAGEFDRVYEAAPQALQLRDDAQQLRIEQSASWAETVVWNPGADKGAALADLPPDGHRRLLCVEAAQVRRPITVEPGTRWQGWQRLVVG